MRAERRFGKHPHLSELHNLVSTFVSIKCMNTQYQIIYWRDIPAQVKVRAGTIRLARKLSERFQEGIDKAAMRTGTTGTEEYLSAWRTSKWQQREGEAEAVADGLALELENAYPSNRLLRLVQNGGFDPEISMESKG